MRDAEESWPRAMPMDLRGAVEVAEEERVVTAIDIAPEAPVFAGHYPHFPLLPGALVVEAAFQALEQQAARFGRSVRLRALETVRLLAPVQPGDRLVCDGRVRERRSPAELLWEVVCTVGETRVAKVRLALEVEP